MITVNQFKDTITGAVNGIPYTVVYTRSKYDALKGLESQAAKASSIDELAVIVKEFELLINENYGSIVAANTPYVWLDPKTGHYHLRHGKQTLRHRMPPGLVQRLIESVEQRIDPLPLLKFYVKFLLNPKYSHDKLDRIVAYINMLYRNKEREARLITEFGVNPTIAASRATVRQTPITLEGMLVAYKVVDEIGDRRLAVNDKGEIIVRDRYEGKDAATGLRKHGFIEELEKLIFEPCVQHSGGDAFMCGDRLGHIIKIGEDHYLQREDQINCSDTQDCVPGLHCGNLNYIESYQTEGTATLNIFIDPRDVRAIPMGESIPAIRVKRFFAHSLFGVQNTSLYSSSAFVADATEESFEQMMARAIYELNDVSGLYEPKDYGKDARKAHFA